MQSVNQKNIQSVKMYRHFPVFLSIFLLDLSSSSIKKFKDTCMLHSTYDSGQVRLREKVELKVHTFLFLESETTIRERVIRCTHFSLILWASTHLGNSFVSSRSFGGPNNNLKISVTLGISFKCT